MSVAFTDLVRWKKEVEDSSTPVAVEFWSPVCPWCQRLEPIYQECSVEYSDRMKFFKVNVFSDPQLAMRYGVMSTPTIKFLCSGRPVDEHVGFASREQLEGKVDGVLSSYRRCMSQSLPYG